SLRRRPMADQLTIEPGTMRCLSDRLQSFCAREVGAPRRWVADQGKSGDLMLMPPRKNLRAPYRTSCNALVAASKPVGGFTAEKCRNGTFRRRPWQPQCRVDLLDLGSGKFSRGPNPILVAVTLNAICSSALSLATCSGAYSGRSAAAPCFNSKNHIRARVLKCWGEAGKRHAMPWSLRLLCNCAPDDS